MLNLFVYMCPQYIAIEEYQLYSSLIHLYHYYNNDLIYHEIVDISFTTNVQEGTVFARRVGNIVTINAWSKAVQSLGTSNDYAHIGTLPESMQPKTSYLTYTFINNNILGQIIVNSEGVKIGYCKDLANNAYDIKNNENFYFTISCIV